MVKRREVFQPNDLEKIIQNSKPEQTTLSIPKPVYSNVNFSKAGMYATEIFLRIWKESSPGISEFQGRFAPSLRGIRQTQTYSRPSHISKTHLSVDRVEII